MVHLFDAPAWIAVTGSLLASLMGSGHCAGMCGGLVGLSARQDRSLLGGVALHGPRVLTYIALGALAGALGQSVLSLGVLGWLNRLSIALWAVMLVLMAFRLARGEGSLGHGFSGYLFRRSGSFGRARPLVLGLGMAFLPCGWLHGFLVTAALSGSPVLGALTLGGFGLGTLPALGSLALLSRASGFAQGTWLRNPRVAASAWLFFGLVSLGLQAGIWGAHSHSHSHVHGQALDRSSSELHPREAHHAHASHEGHPNGP